MGKTYGDLYLYIEKKFAKKIKREHKEAFHYTKEFLQLHHIPNPSRIIQILSDFGAASDIEILWSVVSRIKDSTEMTKDIETPVEYALRNEYYTRWHEGMWVRCKKDGEGATLDVNHAFIKMERYKQ